VAKEETNKKTMVTLANLTPNDTGAKRRTTWTKCKKSTKSTKTNQATSNLYDITLLVKNITVSGRSMLLHY